MNDLIRKHDVIDALHKKRIATMEKGQDVNLIWECLDVVGQVSFVSATDMVEVIRCENCEHGYYFVNAHTDNCGTSVRAKVYCRIWQDWVSANGYCFLADKRGGHNDTQT